MPETVADNVARVLERIAGACGRCGRDPQEVTIVAAAKKVAPERVREAVESGIRIVGENRVQEARQKIPLCQGTIEWHMIGHLQTNKVGLAVELFEMIHSIDSLRLLETVNRVCGEKGRGMRLCIEVNVAGESSKFGVAPADVPAMLDAGSGLPNVEIVGLMTIPPFQEDAEETRRFYRQLRELRDECRESMGIPLPELSIGMSHDLETAIEEGATMVRPGTAVFGVRT